MLQQGYLLQITSWENDGDCYNTKSIGGLTLAEVKEYDAFLRVFTANCRQVELTDSIVKVLFAALPSSLLKDEDEKEEEYEGHKNDSIVSDVVYNLVGFGYESDRTRVVESWTIHFIPFDIEEVKL